MTEIIKQHCPQCKWELREPLGDSGVFACPECQRRFEIVHSPEDGELELIDHDFKPLPEPLFLPRGSIRASSAIAMAASRWVMVASKLDVPNSLLGLLLTIVGYYFGFRIKAASPCRVRDMSRQVDPPLFLPGGAVRFILMIGFVASALYLLARWRACWHSCSSPARTRTSSR
jgi:hypothetical protein